MKRVILYAVLLFLAGASNGIMDDLQFHYQDTIFSKLKKERFWNPAISWTNKYAHDKEGKLIKPLRPKFWGSANFFAFTTDAWHLFKFIHLNALRLLMAFLFVELLRWDTGNQDDKRTWWGSIIFTWLLIVFVQQMGFILTYNLL